MEQKFSVLMSLYIKEKPEYARECFESLLKQTVKANEWVIVEDGPLTKELYDLLDEYQELYPGMIKRVPLNENKGLGLALREGVINCSYELIARMDTDDIARADRFEKQLKMFENDFELDICGSHIKEFITSPDVVTAVRKVPLLDDEIKQYQKKRDGVNHVTVMFKKKSVINAGNYQHALLMEDTLLWVNMILVGAKFANIDDYLVYVRTGKDMYERRGGYAYYQKYKAGRKMVYDTGYISKFDYYYTLFVQLVMALVPNSVRSMLFVKLLRTSGGAILRSVRKVKYSWNELKTDVIYDITRERCFV